MQTTNLPPPQLFSEKGLLYIYKVVDILNKSVFFSPYNPVQNTLLESKFHRFHRTYILVLVVRKIVHLHHLTAVEGSSCLEHAWHHKRCFLFN